MESERPENIFETRSTPAAVAAEPAEPQTVDAIVNELDQPQWSVISFKKIEAAGLTYRQAAAGMIHFDSLGISGLCIVTDEAAARITA